MCSHEAASANHKKTKKSQISKSSTTQSLDVNDRAALDRRAQRFRREHEIEQQKRTQGGQASLKASHHTAHIFDDPMDSRSSSPFANADEPEADPVRVRRHAHVCKAVVLTHAAAECSKLGSVYHSWNIAGNI